MTDLNKTIKLGFTIEARYQQYQEVEVPAYKAARILHKIDTLRGFALEEYVQTIMGECGIDERWGDLDEWEIECDTFACAEGIEEIDMSDDEAYFELDEDSML